MIIATLWTLAGLIPALVITRGCSLKEWRLVLMATLIGPFTWIAIVGAIVEAKNLHD